MSDVFDIYTVIFLVLAVFILVRLRSVLGTRTGNERPRDYARDTAPQTANENVIPMPPRPDAAAEPVDPALRWKGFAEDGTPVAKGLDDIVAADPTFEPASFVQGARAAYEMIVQAFAAGDTRTLKGLLAKDVFDSFAATIADRERRGETVESRFVSIDKADIRDAEMRGGSAQIEVRFASQLVTATRDKDGNVIDGNADAVTEVIDIWTFARDAHSRDPNWKLVSTEAA
ncbi:Tim44/TimA family putative adaptor protein [Flaviflagellibacter deserti]|uniref:Tim44/TimA family putative adaptor protein n=1 Tax=Flaviflagellibacter deserti TaxID=2267266 RepID=A0ABV9Z6T7_9HYPH